MTAETSLRGESHKLINILKTLTNTFVNIRVLGDWVFIGRLTKVECELATLIEVTVVSAAGLTLSTFEVDRVTINLEAITSIGKPTFLPFHE